ncbi:unnamed protein product [Heterobilharzia americana]|nr:unnamed protein product [Heterobilharzia americana]
MLNLSSNSMDVYNNNNNNNSTTTSSSGNNNNNSDIENSCLSNYSHFIQTNRRNMENFEFAALDEMNMAHNSTFQQQQLDECHDDLYQMSNSSWKFINTEQSAAIDSTNIVNNSSNSNSLIVKYPNFTPTRENTTTTDKIASSNGSNDERMHMNNIHAFNSLHHPLLGSHLPTNHPHHSNLPFVPTSTTETIPYYLSLKSSLSSPSPIRTAVPTVSINNQHTLQNSHQSNKNERLLSKYSNQTITNSINNSSNTNNNRQPNLNVIYPWMKRVHSKASRQTIGKSINVKHQIKKQTALVNPIQHLETSEIIEHHQHHIGHFEHTELKSSTKSMGTDQLSLNEPLSPSLSVSQVTPTTAKITAKINTIGQVSWTRDDHGHHHHQQEQQQHLTELSTDSITSSKCAIDPLSSSSMDETDDICYMMSQTNDPKRTRTAYTRQQILELEKEFHYNKKTNQDLVSKSSNEMEERASFTGMKQRLIESRSPNANLNKSHNSFNNTVMINTATTNTTTTINNNNNSSQDVLSHRNPAFQTSSTSASLPSNPFQIMTRNLKPCNSLDSNNSVNCSIVSTIDNSSTVATSLPDQWSSMISSNLHTYSSTVVTNTLYPSSLPPLQHHSYQQNRHGGGIYNPVGRNSPILSDYISPVMNSDHPHFHSNQLHTRESHLNGNHNNNSNNNNNNTVNVYLVTTAGNNRTSDPRYHTTSINDIHLSKVIRQTYLSNTMEMDEQQNLCLTRNYSNQSDCSSSVCSGQNSNCGSNSLMNSSSIHSREATG